MPSQRFNARYIELNVGNAQRKSVSIYRALHATQVGSSGCLAGTVENENGVEPWALLTLTVTPTIGAPLVFVAQADAYGDFVLPVNEAPALDKDAPSETYPSDLVIQRVAIEPGTQLPNPDDLADLDIESLTIENQFCGAPVDSVGAREKELACQCRKNHGVCATQWRVTGCATKLFITLNQRKEASYARISSPWRLCRGSQLPRQID